MAASGGIALVYDPLGRLFQLIAGANTTTFLYDGDALVAEYDSAGAMTHRYVHGPGADVPMVQYDSTIAAGATTAAADRRFLLADQQGSIVAVADNAGTRLAVNAYDEYGIPGTTHMGRFAYTGQIRLPELGMYHYKARIYSPSLGRFMQTDPVGYEGGINLYGYVGNDPLNLTDPTGECARTPGPNGATYSGVCAFPEAEKFVQERMTDSNSEIAATDAEAVRNNRVIYVRLGSNDTQGQAVIGGTSELDADPRQVTVTLDPTDNPLVRGHDADTGATVSRYSESLEETAEHEIAGEARSILGNPNAPRGASGPAAVDAENRYRERRANPFRRQDHWGQLGQGPARRWPGP